MKVDQALAREILEEEAAKVLRKVPGDPEWAALVADLSAACDGASLTPIAVLGTALLSKATNPKIDPFSLKVSDGNRGYSARAVAQHVLAACAPRLGIDLGVHGREPLNNQPFFGEARISMDLPWKSNALPAAKILVDLLRRIDKMKSSQDARGALRAYLQVRKKNAIAVSLGQEAGDDIGIHDLINFVQNFVESNSEKGKRAQAVVAGLLDVACGPDRVLVTKVHDPDRNFPCDVAVRSAATIGALERTFEVRDKAVSESDLYHSVGKCAAAGVSKLGVVAVAHAQRDFEVHAVTTWAEKQGVVLRLFAGWAEFVLFAVFSSPAPGNVVGAAYRACFERLKQLDVSGQGLEAWKALSSLR